MRQNSRAGKRDNISWVISTIGIGLRANNHICRRTVASQMVKGGQRWEKLEPGRTIVYKQGSQRPFLGLRQHGIAAISTHGKFGEGIEVARLCACWMQKRLIS